MPTPSQISLYSNFEKGVETVREVSEDMDHIDKVTPIQDKDTVQTTNDRLVLNDTLSVAKAIVVRKSLAKWHIGSIPIPGTNAA